MYKDLITGSQAKTELEKGNDVEVVVRGQWERVTKDNRHLLRSDLFIFRVLPKKHNEMLNAIQANRITLDNCPRHRFILDKITMGEKCQCLRCGGWMPLTSIGDYVRGFVAAKGDPCEIVPDWYGESISSQNGWHLQQPVTCPHCKGSGYSAILDADCRTCSGKGSLRRVEAVGLTIGNQDVIDPRKQTANT